MLHSQPDGRCNFGDQLVLSPHFICKIAVLTLLIMCTGTSGCGSGSRPPSGLSCVWTFVILLLSVVGATLTFGAVFCYVPPSDHVVICVATLIVACCLLYWVALDIFVGHWPLVSGPCSFRISYFYPVYGVVAGYFCTLRFQVIVPSCVMRWVIVGSILPL